MQKIEEKTDNDSTRENQTESGKKEALEKEEQQNKQILDMGQITLNENANKYKVELLTIIGEVEGHESAPYNSQTTKYEHVLPRLATIEDDESVDGLLVLLNTVGGSWNSGTYLLPKRQGRSPPPQLPSGAYNMPRYTEACLPVPCWTASSSQAPASPSWSGPIRACTGCRSRRFSAVLPGFRLLTRFSYVLPCSVSLP